MILLNPSFLLFMGLPLLILGFLIVTNKKNIHNIFSSKMIEKLTIKRSYLGKVGRNITLFASLGLFIIALSRPVLPKGDITLSTTKYSFCILLDISNSMMADDKYPNRLEFAKQKIGEFLSEDLDANVAIYAFSDNLYQIAPKTSDFLILKYLIKNFTPPKDIQKASNIKNAIKHIKDKNIIVFSDLDFKEFESDKNIIFFKTATNHGGAIKIKNGYLSDRFGNIVISKPNQTIKSFTDISKIQPKKQKSQTYIIKKKDELFYYPLFLALLLLSFTFISLPKLKIFMFLALFFLPSPSDALFFDFYHIYKAKKYYESKEYSLSLEEFKKVANEKKSFQTYYNLANCYFKLKNYKKAYYFYLLSQKLDDNEKVRYNLNLTKKVLNIKSVNNKSIKVVKIKQKSVEIKEIKQKTKLIKITDAKGEDDISW